MTKDRDPFELLARFNDPEPDPVVMNAVIAQSREVFARRSTENRPAERPSFFRFFPMPASWIAPLGASAIALVVVVMVVPGIMDMPDQAPTQSEQLADADLPASAPPSNQLSRGTDQPTSTGTRMGFQPAPGQLPVEPAPVDVSFFEGNGVRIDTRIEGSLVEIYLPDLSGERAIDSQMLMPGESFSVIDAFTLPNRNIIAIRFAGTNQNFWRVYQLVDDVYARDTELSNLVLDAADQAEVESRLEG